MIEACHGSGSMIGLNDEMIGTMILFDVGRGTEVEGGVIRVSRGEG
jgi:hypothetical protein